MDLPARISDFVFLVVIGQESELVKSHVRSQGPETRSGCTDVRCTPVFQLFHENALKGKGEKWGN